MATYSTYADFLANGAGLVADETTPTTIAGWTYSETASNLWTFNSVSDGTSTEGGIIVESRNNGTGDYACGLQLDDPGSIASATETDVLFRFYLSALAPAANLVGGVRKSSPLGSFYCLDVDGSGDILLARYTNAGKYNDVGTRVTKGISAATWYWVRINVTAAGSWSWKVWAGAVGDEPGTPTTSWDQSGNTQTTVQLGYVGPIGFRYTSNPVKYDWFSVGTGTGVAAPSPGGGGGGIIPQAMNYYKQQQ